MISASGADEAFFHAMNIVLNAGQEVAPRGDLTKEALGLGIVINNPRDRLISCPIRNLRTDYQVANVAWNLDERSDVESICWWNENGRAISDDGVTFHGANYGERIMWQVERAVQLLRHDRDSRRAFVSIWDQDTEVGYWTDGKDVPCTVGFGLRVINGQLVTQTVMRSQSVVGVMPYDMFLFLTLHELIANDLGVGVGPYMHYMLSSHIYEREYEWAKDMVTWYEEHGSRSEAMHPVRYTLAEARGRWSKTMDDLAAGGPPPEDMDQFEALMTEGASTRWAEHRTA